MPKILDFLVKAFLVLLPFSVFLSVFFSHKLGVPGANSAKELLLLLIAGTVAFGYWKNRRFPEF